MRFARRLSQLFFFLLFVYLFLQAAFPYAVRIPSDLFLRASPLVGISTFLASRSFVPALWIGFLLLGLTLLLGRFFCGWLCPLGTLVDFSDKVILRKKTETFHTQKYRSWKFVLLVFILIAAVFAVQFVWLFDPIVILFRALTTIFYPVFVFIVFGFFNLAFKIEILENPVYALYDAAQKTIIPIEQPPIVNGLPILVLFVGIFALGFWSRRFWCRSLCPLGALFGLFSRYRVLQRNVDDSCTACGRCAERCRMQAIHDNFKSTNPVECIECGQCVDECPSRSISYRPVRRTAKVKSFDLTRRHLLFAGIAGVTGAVFVRSTRARASSVIRPPGAIEEKDFLEKCIRCQACSHICASTGGCLFPSFSESGFEGLWTPVVMPSLGYCEFNCTLCGQVCPTGAIQVLPVEEKQRLKIGTAFFDKNACIPWRDSVNCLVCEEHCPLPEKAIKFDEREVHLPTGEQRNIKFPYVVRDLCIGCGICETRCPVVGSPGIYVTAENNQRIKI